MNPKQRVIDQINHRETDFVPYRLAFEVDDLRDELDNFYGNAKWRELLDNHILYLEQPHPGLAIPYSDPLYEGLWKDCFGGQWDITKQPAHIAIPPLKEPSMDGYQFPNVNDCIASGWVERSCNLIAEHPNHFIVARLGFGLFERSWALRGFENALMDAAVEGNFYRNLIENISVFQNNLLDFILDRIPVDGVLFADDWGFQKGVLIGAERWRKFLRPHIAGLYKKVHNAGKFTLNHVCGSIYPIMHDLIEIGLDVLESVQPEAKDMDPYKLKKEFGEEITFFGGIGSQSIIQFGSPDEIKTEVSRIIEIMPVGGGYILAPAKPIQPGTPPENTAALLEAFLDQAGIII